MFHIDFGFIFDRDPKPLPPPMRLNRDMIEGMGGIDSEQYNKFKSFCFDAFQSLRRLVSLIWSKLPTPVQKIEFSFQLFT